MKRYFMAIVLTVLMAAPAAAQDSGVYVGLKFIDSIQSSGQVSKGGWFNGVDAGEYSQNTIGGGIYLGYDFYVATQIPLRAEIEYDIRSTASTEWDINKSRYIDGTVKSDWNLQTLFLNFYYDFHNDSDFTPYIGAGIGLGFLRTEYEVDGTLKQGINAGRHYNSTGSDMQTAFAWNVGVGCSYAITDNFSADLAYRFVRMGFTESDSVDGGLGGKVGMAPYANEFSLGFRYTF